jgi:hypothetical protein
VLDGCKIKISMAIAEDESVEFGSMARGYDPYG